ncbi:E3 ubiquitin ligase PUB14, putative [Medicago truncatula]|uniref:E3 ubiquitin ligase PUB14, putative n=1 Tax=Medicago truncatula TaxID=3880 RepID=G7ZY86_MEDTR|nr:E3 ubiquitin ligase PUB14, putative [Medicago truncatula]
MKWRTVFNILSRHGHFITIKCFEILENLSSDDGIDLCIDGEGEQLELGNIITDLIARQQHPNASHYFRMPALCAHLGICKIETSLVKKAVLTANVVSLILPLLNDSDSEIRETAISLLFLFSQYEPERFVEYLFWPRRLKALVRFLGMTNIMLYKWLLLLLANLPKSERKLTMQ